MATWPNQKDVNALVSKWQAEITELQRKIDVCTEAMRLFDEATSAPLPDTPSIDVEFIRKCRTQREALREIAKRNEGVVRAKDAAPLILEAGLSKGKLTSVVSTTHNLLNNGDEWEYIEPGTFKLVDLIAGNKESPANGSQPFEVWEYIEPGTFKLVDLIAGNKESPANGSQPFEVVVDDNGKMAIKSNDALVDFLAGG